MKKLNAIIVDLDGTACDTTHRQHFMQKKPKDWKGFYAGIKDDPPNEWCMEIIRRFCLTHEIIFVSGRPSEYKPQTVEWIMRQFPFINGLRDFRLHMRLTGDYRKDSVVKTEIYKSVIEPHYKIFFCIDDRQQVVDAWRALGLTCLQCAPGDF